MTNGTYRYRARSYVTISGVSNHSNWRYSSNVTVNRKPGEVKNFTEPPVGVTQTEDFDLIWQAPTGASDPIDGYEVKCNINGTGFTYTTCGGQGLGAIPRMWVSLPEGTQGEVKFQVRAHNSQGWGAWTSSTHQKSVSVNIPLPTPTSEQITVPASSDYGDFDISWSANGAVTEWKLKRWCRTGAANPICNREGWHDIPLSPKTRTNYLPRGYTADEYQFHVQACNGSSCTGWVRSDPIKVHNLENLSPAVGLAAATSPGNMDYSTDVSFQGDAMISVPVQPAPGVNSLVPNIGIRYSGARYRQRVNEVLPEDILGYGWRLSGFGEIRRCVVGRPNGVRIQLNTTDLLCLNGETLRLAYGSYWAVGSRYRTSRYGLQLVELKKDANGKIWFEVSTPDGRVQEYGKTEESRLKVGTSTEFGWSLNKVTDTFGNSIEYRYHLDTVEGINYPLEILYGNGGDARITFEYGTRTDAPPRPLVPDEIEQGQLVLLHHIKVALDGKPLREYRLISEDEGQIEDYRRLQYIQLCAYDENATAFERGEVTSGKCLEPLELTWIDPSGGNPEVEFKTGVETVTDGLGAITWFKYAMIQDASSVGQFSERPFGEGIPPVGASPLQAENGKYRCVVGEVRRSNGLASEWHKTSYAYQGTGFVSNNHRGFLGYYAQRVTDAQSGVVTYRQFRLDFPYFGKVARQYQYQGEYPSYTQVLSKRQFRYSEKTLVTGDPNIQTAVHYPVLLESLETLYENNQQLGYRFTSNAYSKASYGTAGELINGLVRTEKTATEADAPATQDFWGEVEAVVSVNGVLRSVETTTSFQNRVSGSWLIGFANGEDVRYYKGDTDTTPDRVQTTTAIPHAASNKLDSINRFAGDPELSLTIAYEYNAQGNLISETTSGANIETRVTTANGYAKGDNRYPETLTNAEGHTVTVTYDPRFGSAATVTDADQRTTRIDYDPFGRETSRTNTDDVTFSTSYDFCLVIACPAAGVYRVRSSSSITPTADRYYDLLGRLVRQDAASFDGATVTRREFAYDELGRLYSETAPFFEGEYKPITIYQYDDLSNRLKQVDRPDGSQQRITYTPLAATHQIEQKIEEDVLKNNGTLAETQVKLNLYNLTGDLVKTTDADGGTDADGNSVAVTTDYTYYGSGLVETVKINGDNTTKSTFFYNDAGYRYGLTDPNLGTVITAYDALGQPIGQTDNEGQFIEYVYDKLGRLRFQADGEGVAEWTYDPANATGALASRHYVEGAVLVGGERSGGQPAFSETYIYNPTGTNGAGRLDSTSTTLTVGGASETYTHSYGYDTRGRLNSVAYPGNVQAQYQYNTQGYLSQITDGSNPLKTFNDVNAFGQVNEEVYGNGVVTNRTYNPHTGRLETIDTGVKSGIQNNEYRWRSNGTLESRLAYNGGQIQRQENFGYDSLNRLETASLSIGGARTLTTQYDKLGNIELKASSHAGDTSVTGYGYGQTPNAGPNAVSSVSINGEPYTLNYDANGAITFYDDTSSDNDGNKWITWNTRQLPTEITAGPSQAEFTAQDRFKYGPNGQRYYRESSWMEDGELKTEIAFIVGSYEDQYPADDPKYQRIQKVRVDSNLMQILASGVLGDETHYRYLHRDHLGSIEKVTDKDGNLLVGTAYNLAFDPYGGWRKADWSAELSEQELEDLLNEVGLSTRRGFTGHEYLDRTGLIHMNGRVYDPTLGRFLSPDPIVQAPGYSQSWNRYSYVFNSPLSLVDPSGYESCCYNWDDYDYDPCDYSYNTAACPYDPCENSDPGAGCDDPSGPLDDDLCFDFGICGGGGGNQPAGDTGKARAVAARASAEGAQKKYTGKWLGSRDIRNKTLAAKINVDADGNISSNTITVSFEDVSETTAKAYIQTVENGWTSISLDLELVPSGGDLRIVPCTAVCSVNPVDGGYLGAAGVGGRTIYYGASQYPDTPVHEFGHILGLRHSTPVGRTGSIMDFRPRAVSGDDLLRVRALYE